MHKFEKRDAKSRTLVILAVVGLAERERSGKSDNGEDNEGSGLCVPLFKFVHSCFPFCIGTRSCSAADPAPDMVCVRSCGRASFQEGEVACA